MSSIGRRGFVAVLVAVVAGCSSEQDDDLHVVIRNDTDTHMELPVEITDADSDETVFDETIAVGSGGSRWVNLGGPGEYWVTIRRDGEETTESFALSRGGSADVIVTEDDVDVVVAAP